jgi:hypothetical protein
MFKVLASQNITADEIKNRILAYAALKVGQGSEQAVWRGNLVTYTLNLRLSGVIKEKMVSQDNSRQFEQWQDAVIIEDLDRYIYQKSSIFLRDTQHQRDNAFVEKIYRVYLKRKADTGGQEGYLQQLRDGRSRASIVVELRKSEEALQMFLRVTQCLDDPNFLRTAYRVYSDQTDLTIPDDVITTSLIGKQREEILFSIQRSQELRTVLALLPDDTAQRNQLLRSTTLQDYYQDHEIVLRLLQNTEPEAFLKSIYRIYLHREADPGGLESYLQSMNQGTSRASLIESMQESEEGKTIFLNLTSSINHQAFIRITCWAYLKSEPTQDTISTHLDRLDKNVPRAEVLEAILQLVSANSNSFEYSY